MSNEIKDTGAFRLDMARRPGRVRRFFGYVGIVLALPFFVWLVVGLVPGIPSMVDIFGIPGLRWPASVTVLGLLIGAIGFWEY